MNGSVHPPPLVANRMSRVMVWFQPFYQRSFNVSVILVPRLLVKKLWSVKNALVNYAFRFSDRPKGRTKRAKSKIENSRAQSQISNSYS
jgi:hypothetical protein